MYPPGSGYAPTLNDFASTCDPSTGASRVSFSVNKAISGTTCTVVITDDATQATVFADSFTTNAQSYRLPAAGVPALPNGDYTLKADNGENEALVSFTVACAAGSPCDLVLQQLTPIAPTTPGGFGYVSFTYTTAATSVAFSVAGPVTTSLTLTQRTSGQVNNLPAGTYAYGLSRADQPACQVTGSFTIGDAPAPPDPSLSAPARWEPVGGVLPNPVLLAVEARLTDAQGGARAGLHVEVELWRPGATAAFARFRASVRTAAQLVDAAPYLRAELRAAQRYAATASAPLVDADAGLRFTYRFRVVDSTGAEPWLTRAGERWAVLAALPGAADTLQPYVADGTGRVTSVFPDGEAVQAVGLSLEASVLLPPNAAGGDRYAELRYLDAYGQELEIRAFRLPDQAAGVLRIPLPGDPLPCAAAVEVSVRDDNRAYLGSCPGTVTPPPVTTGAILADHGRLLR